MKHRRLLILSVLVVALLAGGCGLWVRQAKRQYALNRQLIAALIRNDSKQALALVNVGADPNTRYVPTPAPTFTLLLNQLLHRAIVPINDSPTAFLIACGGIYHSYPEDMPLVQAMLAHGADSKVVSNENMSALQTAVLQNYPKVAQLLLEHGATSNEHYDDGSTLLMKATAFGYTNMVAVLVEHGANTSCEDSNGDAVLLHAIRYEANKNILLQLVTHGANPNQRNPNGISPLMLAQCQKRPDIIALLCKGAK